MSAEDFSDQSIVVVAPYDPRVASISSNHCRFEQACDGPTFLVVGPFARDDQLRRASERFDLPFSTLSDFRQDLRCEYAERPMLGVVPQRTLDAGKFYLVDRSADWGHDMERVIAGPFDLPEDCAAERLNIPHGRRLVTLGIPPKLTS